MERRIVRLEAAIDATAGLASLEATARRVAAEQGLDADAVVAEARVLWRDLGHLPTADLTAVLDLDLAEVLAEAESIIRESGSA